MTNDLITRPGERGLELRAERVQPAGRDEDILPGRVVHPLPVQALRPPPRRNPVGMRGVMGAATVILLLVGLLAWPPGDFEASGARGVQPTITVPADSSTSVAADAIRVVERLIDAANQNDFAVYAALSFEDRVVNTGGLADGCGDSWCTGEREPAPAVARQAARDLLAFLHALEASWMLSDCVTSAPSVEFAGDIAVACRLSYQRIDREVFGEPPVVEDAHFRVTPDGVIDHSTFAIPVDEHPLRNSRFHAWTLGRAAESSYSAKGAGESGDGSARGIYDPCRLFSEEDPGDQDEAPWAPPAGRECADWVLEQLELYRG